MASSTLDESRWQRFREQMPVTQRWAYFDHAAVAPLPQPCRAAMGQWLQEATEEGDTQWPRWSGELGATRQTAARILGASADDLALVANTTTGIGLVAEGLDWRPGDNVVLPANEFPSNQYAWLNLVSRGVEVRRIPPRGVAVTPGDLLAACDGRTRLISASWVGYATGYRIDVAELVAAAHGRGILVLLDAIQGLGVFPLDVRKTPVDFLAADGHKWLLGPEGAGLLYIRREHLDKLRPLGLGWHSVAHAHDFSRIELDLKPQAARYEGGSHNMSGFIGLGASLRCLEEAGLGSIAATAPLAERVLWLTDLACQRLSASGARIISSRAGGERSGIVAFEMPGREPLPLKKHCLSRGVVITVRGGWLRISPHAYNNEEDIERLVSALASGG